jgi:hypothetical protein
MKDERLIYRLLRRSPSEMVHIYNIHLKNVLKK